jgi:hypothetical protein
VNIPVGVGVFMGSLIAGFVYAEYGEKATLALKHLNRENELLPRAVRCVDWSDNLALAAKLADVDRANAFELAQQHLGQDAAQAADTLRRAFRFDQGQIENLCLQFLALEDALSGDAKEKLSKALIAAKVDDEKKSSGREAQIVAEANRTGKALEAGNATLESINVASFVEYLPDAVGRKRTEVFEIVRDRVNKRDANDDEVGATAIIDMLWSRFGDDPAVLDNLALEYLAQATDAVAENVKGMEFTKPVKEMEKAIGIGRTKAFAALNGATGADEAAVRAALDEIPLVTDHDSDRAFVYLVRLPHVRFQAVNRRDWTTQVPFLRELIDGDPAAKKVAEEKLEGSLDYQLLADELSYVRAALDEKDWAATPRQAAQLLGLNPYEAAAMVSAELGEAPKKSTQLLWRTYHPQYKVWIPFASIGVLATIALAVFGQMAKRWTDMNA